MLPFRDAAGTLRAALASLLAQEGADFEVLAVDDHSADGSAAIVEAAGDPRVRLLENAGAPGVVGAANTGIRAARAPWIARMDADDLAAPRRLRRQLDFAAGRPELGVVACEVALLEGRGEGMARYVGWANGLRTPEEIAAARFIESPVVNPGAMVRADWMERAGGYRDVPWAEDHDLWLRLLEAGCRIARVPEVLLEWRDSGGRLTRTDERYGSEARTLMRAHYLARLDVVRERGVVMAGAGPIGKGLARRLRAEGVGVRAFLEVNPRRIGQRIHGAPVLAAESLDPGRGVLLGAVGVPGGRDRVRRLAREAGFTEGLDFWCVC